MKSTMKSVCVKSVSLNHEDRNACALRVAAIVFLMLGLLSTNVFSSTVTLVPSPSDLGDLDHDHYYTWGIVQPIADGEEITGAVLTFKDIRNWQTESNRLYVHLLDSARNGVYIGNDTRTGDYFAGQGVSLVTYTNLPATPQTFSYNFSADQLATLNSYARDGRFALGFDPDCHFYNNGISLNLTTSSVVPEPATITMLLLCAATLAIGRRRHR